MTEQIPQRLYLVGGGRHPTTKTARRAARFERRVFQIAGITIRPNRRKDVNPAFIEKHLDAILEHVKDGTLIVQHRHDKFMDEAELRALVAAMRGETVVQSEVPTLPAPPEPEEVEEADDAEVPDLPEGDGTNPAAPPDAEVPPVLAPPPTPAQEVQETPDSDPNLKEAQEALQERLVDDGEAEVPETAPETQETPEAEQQVEQVEETEQPEAEPEVKDVVEATADTTSEAKVARTLPDGWDKKSKKDLVKFCKERGIVIESDRVSNTKLIELLQGWLAG